MCYEFEEVRSTSAALERMPVVLVKMPPTDELTLREKNHPRLACLGIVKFISRNKPQQTGKKRNRVLHQVCIKIDAKRMAGVEPGSPA